MKIGNALNISIANRMQETSLAINRSLERLSTGSRINRAGDDIASFSVATNLDAKARGLRQASINLNTGYGYFLTAETALADQLEIAQAIRDIGIAGQDSSLTAFERAGLQSQLDDFVQSFNEIANNSSFGDLKLLNGSTTSLDFTLDEKANLGSLSFQSSRAQDNFTLSIGNGSLSELSSGLSGVTTGQDVSQILVDFDSEGSLDLVALDGDANLTVALGNGVGGFNSEQVIELGSGVEGKHVAAADLNGDGALDLAAYVVNPSGTDYIAILENDGSGNFSITSTLAAAENLAASSFVIADINGNGEQDIVAIDGNDELRIFYGNGDGSFQAATTLDTGAATVFDQIKAVDINGNGLTDLIVGNTSGGVQVLSGDGAGNFSLTETIVASDVDGFIIQQNESGAPPNVLVYGLNVFQVYTNDGTGNFTGEGTNLTSADIVEAAEVDFNRDGRKDLALRLTNGDIEIYEKTESGYSLKSSFAGSYSESLIAGDLDGDGVEELVSFNSSSGGFVSLQFDRIEVNATDRFEVGSIEAATRLIEIADNAIASISQKIVRNGYQLERLESWQESADSMALVTEESLDELVSVDFAAETAELVKQQILQEAQAAALTQLNLNSQLVLELLRF